MKEGFSINDFLRNIGLPVRPFFRITGKESFLEAVENFKILPFFPNGIKGLSIEEMCIPGMLFGGNYDEGCWEWKGPVIRKHISAYGKIFRKKAGFISLDLLPDFLNYRRNKYPVKEGTTEEMLLEIIRENDSLTSTELKSLIFGNKRKRNWDDVPDNEIIPTNNGKRKSLEAPLQNLQMGGWIVISDFEYKKTKNGERYGWGVARYSTPEVFTGQTFTDNFERTPAESLDILVTVLKKIWPTASRKTIENLLK